MLELRRCVELDPTNSEDRLRVGAYEQSKGLHLMAIKTFTKAIEVMPTLAEAYLGRGISQAQLLRDEEAIRELCQAVHLDPLNARAFFHRGLLLRKLAPKQALQDLSVSLLLDNSEANLHAYVHRGMLYLETKRYGESLRDFKKGLELDGYLRSRSFEVSRPVSRVAVLCYCQIGYIYVHHSKNYMAAVRAYGEAIREDPTYVQALLSRAECYFRVHRDCGGSDSCLDQGITDYGKAIRLHPDRPEYFILRGKLLLAKGATDLATDQVRAASGLQSGTLGDGHSFVQAQVQAFLGNHEVAADTLKGIVLSLSSASLMSNAYGDADEAEVRGQLLSSGYCHKDLPAAHALLGRILMSAGKHGDAIRQFEAALTLDNTNPDWFYDLGKCCSQVNDDELAKEAFSCAIELDHTHAKAFYERGTCRLRMNDARGIQDVNKALGIDQSMWQAYLSRACYYALQQRYTKAILNCNKAVEMEPNSVRGYMTRGCIKYTNGFIDGAIEDLLIAIDHDQNCSLAWYNLAVCYHFSRKPDDALRAYSVVLLLESAPNPVVYLNRGVLYFTERQFSNALHDFLAVAEAPGMADEPRVVHSIALCRHRVGQLERAVEDYTRALALDPQYTAALLGRGNVLTDYGHAEGRAAGRHDYQRAIRASPTDTVGYVNLAYSLQCEGWFQNAWSVLTMALRMNPKDAAVLEARSIVSLQMTDFSAALKDISIACRANETAEVLTNRGVVHIYHGNTVQAMEDFQAAIKLDPTCALGWYNAGNIYLQQKQLTQALEYYDAALRSEPLDECCLSNRALAHTLRGSRKQALADLGVALELSSAPMLWYNRAVVNILEKQWVAAENDLTKFLEVAEEETEEAISDARIKRGWCKFRQEKPDGVQEALVDFVDGC